MTGETEQEEMGEFVRRMTRKPQQGILERTLCFYILQSNGAKPLQAIAHVVNGALLLSPEERKKIGINEDELSILKSIVFPLLNPAESPGEITRHYRLSAWQVFWSFPQTEENFEKFIAPWYHGLQECLWQDEFLREFKDAKRSKRFWHLTNFYLSRAAYNGLVNQFVAWALPIAQGIKARLATLVAPSTLSEMMKLVPQKAESAET